MAMMPESLRHRFLLWSQLRQHRRRVNLARERIERWLSKVEHPYIAYSTGKDSTCILNLVREQAPQTPAVYFDADCAFPESKETLAQIENAISFLADEPLLETFKRLGGPTVKGIEKETMRMTVYGPIARLIKQYDFDGIAYGIRAEESRGRAASAKYHGSVFQYRRDGLWACQPIHDWKYNDVWAHIVSSNLSYCGVYDEMWDMPEDDQRLSYWAGETKMTWGRWAWLKRNYSELFNKFAAEFPEARCYV